MKTLLSIQYLRGGAALAVVLYHALQWESGGFEVGRAGVDVFFVISGVIMWVITADGETGPWRFLWRRATRVAPLYWLATLSVAALALIWPYFLPEVLLGWSHLAASLAFIPHFDPRGRPFPLLPPGWTLTYEAAFYLVFAAALLVPKRRRASAITAALFAIVAAGLLLSDPAYILGANPMLLEFAAGVWLGKLLETGRLPGRALGFALMALGALAYAALEISGFINELWRPLLWGAPAAAIVGGALCLEARGAMFRSRALKTLGDASYAIYLVHLPATALVAHTLGYDRPVLFIPAALAISIAAGLACRAWVEKPLLGVLRGIGRVQPAKAAGELT
ncbi:MAG: acyltransferase [Pseudomonadota bacterium]|nr:acyltransferase [Pseudomonadota bacterium]